MGDGLVKLTTKVFIPWQGSVQGSLGEGWQARHGGGFFEEEGYML